ncbi:MAG TPA: wax ester/triacylglycerol synthase family O-acyltransferase [Solirubrobacteraceae bacterium]|nr:wax ester/triacylglycerol synthase family O-acyltransferase [Solirubrobacteraceae bacterium]
MAEHLSPLDAMFLELEQADESAHMHIGAVAVFDPVPDGPAPTVDDLAQRLHERMDLLPRFTQRLSSARTGGLSWPTWEPAPHFDVRDHLRHATLPAPGSERELVDWTADFYSHRLDRTRPLWETVLLDGLEGGRWAIASKSHHCLVDGVSSVDVGYAVMDGEPEHDHDGSRRAHASTANGSGAPGILLHGARAGLSAARHPGQVLSRARAVVEMLVRDELIAAPTTSLNRPIGGTRRFAAVRVPLMRLDAVRAQLGGTVNDAVLALSAGGLRALLLSRGEPLPADGLRGQVPVNIRDASEKLALGNRLTSLYVHLPVAEDDPLRRYQGVLAEAQRRKHGTQGLGGRTIVEITNLAPPALHAVLAQSLFDVRLFNVTITNVPGPPTTVHAFGAPLREVLPLVPLFARHAVGIAAVSYAGEMVFGLNADRATVPDLEVLADGIRSALAELESLVSCGRSINGGARTTRRPAVTQRP